MALLAEMHYNFITLVYIVSKNITDTTICVCRYSLELKALSSGSLFLKANHRYCHQIQAICISLDTVKATCWCGVL